MSFTWLLEVPGDYILGIGGIVYNVDADGHVVYRWLVLGDYRMLILVVRWNMVLNKPE